MAQQGESSTARRNNVNTSAVVVVDDVYEVSDDEGQLDLDKDLWLTTADGRYCGQMVPVRVGPIQTCQTFNVHKEVLLKSKWFQKALCGNFREAEEQVIDLPEENPDIFHFVVAYLYEERYFPIRSAGSVLDPILDKGKAPEEDAARSEADSISSRSSSRSRSSRSTSRSSSRSSRSPSRGPSRSRSRSRSRSGSRRRGHNRQQARRRHPSREKQLGRHRHTCNCPQCNPWRSTACWSCGARLSAPRPGSNSTYPRITYIHRDGVLFPQTTRNRAAARARRSSGRVRDVIGDQDIKTLLMAYELNIDVYICAGRYLVDGLQKAVQRSTIDMLEVAGHEAAKPKVLQLCSRLHAGVPEGDPLLAMVLARVGFLQPLLWKQNPQETSDFLTQNPEVAALMVREMAQRYSAETSPESLLSMEAEPPEQRAQRVPHRRRRRGPRVHRNFL